MQVEQLTQDHLKKINLQVEQQNMSELILTKSYYDEMMNTPYTPQALVKEGEVLAVYGAQMLWDKRCVVWVLFSENAIHYMKTIIKMANAYLQNLDCTRIEAYVRTKFKQGRTFARLTGFEPEGQMDKFFPNGEAATMYAIVR